MLHEARRLHALGLAIHWLQPHSKKPVENRWTTGPRKSIDELKSLYKPGLNMGVRLGKASLIKDGGFLAVIDCDVKSRDKKHIEEMEEKLFELFGERLTDAPRVASGRGNGSRHYYIVTKEPATSRRLAQSTAKVKVLMTGVKPSRSDIERLSTLDLGKGYRMRAAWEISLMGEGAQVVLPPSIHPDSGKHYIWSKPLLKAGELSLTDVGGDGPEKPAHLNVDNDDLGFKPVKVVNLRKTKLSESIIELIETGENCEDRSAALFTASMAMARAGLSREQILSVLTDRENFLGACGYDHAQTNSRERAWKWVEKYTVQKAEGEIKAEKAFNATVKESALQNLMEFDDTEVQAEESAGFHTIGKNGALKPDYQALFENFNKEHPYKTIADMRAVYIFDKTHYVDFTPIEVKGYAEKTFIPPPEDKTRMEFLNKVFSNNICRRSFFVDTTEGKFNFKNGVLDLSKKKGVMVLEPHSPEYGFRGVLPYDYDPAARCPEFYKWLNGIMMDDKTLISLLQEFMGYVVRGGDYKYHKALWLGGIGRNGKSTFVDVLKALIGAGNFSVISIKALMTDKFAGATLDGKIANFSEETSPQELADSGPFKNLTGDGDIFAQKKYGDPYSFRNRAKLIMTYNQIPDLKDLSNGMLSRPIIIPFDKTIKEEDQDRNIKTKLLAELPGIFNFAMRGWNRLEKNGDFTYSARSRKALAKVKEESCNVYQWIENYVRTSTDQQKQLTTQELYDAYESKERYAFKKIEFCRRLKNHPKMVKRWKHTENGNLYLGVEICH